MWTQARAFEHDCGINVDNRVTALLREPDDAGQELQTVCTLPTRITIRKMHAQIALAQSAEDRVGNRVRQSVCIRVPFRAAQRFDGHAAQNERQPFRQTMRVVADADAVHSLKSKVQSPKSKVFRSQSDIGHWTLDFG